MATVSPSVSAKSHKRFFGCSKARSTPLCTAWKNEDGLPLSGASPKRVGRPSFTSYRRRAASNWRAKNRTGSGWQERWSTFCKPWNRNLSCSGGKSLFPKRASDEQMNSELRFHIDELTEEYIAAGMSPEEAHRRAKLDFGGHENLKEQVRDVYRIRLLDATFANLKSAFRFIRKSPTSP